MILCDDKNTWKQRIAQHTLLSGKAYATPVARMICILCMLVQHGLVQPVILVGVYTTVVRTTDYCCTRYVVRSSRLTVSWLSASVCLRVRVFNFHVYSEDEITPQTEKRRPRSVLLIIPLIILLIVLYLPRTYIRTGAAVYTFIPQVLDDNYNFMLTGCGTCLLYVKQIYDIGVRAVNT